MSELLTSFAFVLSSIVMCAVEPRIESTFGQSSVS